MTSIKLFGMKEISHAGELITVYTFKTVQNRDIIIQTPVLSLPWATKIRMHSKTGTVNCLLSMTLDGAGTDKLQRHIADIEQQVQLAVLTHESTIQLSPTTIIPGKILHNGVHQVELKTSMTLKLEIDENPVHTCGCAYRSITTPVYTMDKQRVQPEDYLVRGAKVCVRMRLHFVSVAGINENRTAKM